MSGAIRVFIADDHPIVLAGLRSLIAEDDGLELVGEASAGHAALNAVRALKPDVAVLDISMPELNGILIARRLSEECRSVRVLMLTFHEDRAYVYQALQAGVRGYVLKRTAAETLLQAIRAVHVGGLYVDPAVAGRIFDNKATRVGRASENGTAVSLTERESEVLRFAALGFTNKEIAARLGLGIKSVETYKARGADKLGLKTRAEIVRFASAEGWLTDF